MDLIDRLRQLGERIGKTKGNVGTEEATKNAFVMPFIAALGYDVFNPMEVIPEYIADTPTKKGEKVDYCIMHGGSPAIIMEVKHWDKDLRRHSPQLHRYFHVTKVRFAVLTNGIEYKFFSDLNAPNIMDEKPFLEFKMTEMNETVSAEIKKFHKENFAVDDILDSALQLKYAKEIKELLSEEIKSPSDEFVRHFVTKVYSGRVTSKVVAQFRDLVEDAAKGFVNDLINKRLQLAMQSDEVDDGDSASGNDIVTTEEELQGFRIVQAILMAHVPSDKIFYRDAKTYFNVLFEDNNRKPICRLRFNRSQKYLGVFDADRNEEKLSIDKLEDIYKHAGRIVETAKSYMPNLEN